MSEAHPIIELRPVQGFPDYEVGSDGSVWSNKRGKRRQLKGITQTTGYLRVTLMPGRRQVGVHILVLEAFVGPCPEGMEACHFPDRNRTNNNVANLRWDTPKNNCADAKIHGTAAVGERHGASKLTEDQVRDIRKRFASGGSSQTALAIEYGLSQVSVSQIVLRKHWKHVV